jgi:hypothetical protein
MKLAENRSGRSHAHGRRHAGQSRTACGLYALNWELFWEMPYMHSASPQNCSSCDAVACVPS